MVSDLEKIERSLDGVESWVEGHDYKGYEPFDGLTSVLRPLAFRNKIASQILQQGVRRFPVNLRPVLGISPRDSTKGRGYMAWGYLKRYQLNGDGRYKDKAVACLDWLDSNRSPLYSRHAWGNHFPYVSRGGFIPMHEPTIVWTGLIGQVFIEAFKLFKIHRHREIIESIAEWIVSLPREETDRGLCLSYTMLGVGSIHNSNMIGAAFLAGAAEITQKSEYLSLAKKAMLYSCARQLPDGSWYYGEAPKVRWIDAFHTGYNLDSLKRYQEYAQDNTFDLQLLRGLEFFKRSFFKPSGRVTYYSNNSGPIDIQCASQGIDTLSLFSDVNPDCIPMAMRSASWSIDHMQGTDGHFYFRKYPLGVSNKAPMIHWGQATMFKALAHLLVRHAFRPSGAA
jgi:hypothetical protein